jgi:hypothetical protein
MKKTISKKEANEQVELFFKKITEKTPKEIKKIVRLAKAYNIKLKEKRKTYCRKCLNPYIVPSIHVKDGVIKITCNKCETTCRWKIK